MVVGTSLCSPDLVHLQSFSIPLDLTYCFLTPLLYQVHAHEFPTLARIALDILPIQASSVPCERLFSAAKEIATDKRSRLGPERFEQLQMLKHAWKKDLIDVALWNLGQEEGVVYILDDFKELCWIDESLMLEDSADAPEVYNL